MSTLEIFIKKKLKNTNQGQTQQLYNFKILGFLFIINDEVKEVNKGQTIRG